MNRQYNREGHITVFLSLLLTLVLSLVFTTVEGARVQGAVMQIQNIMDMGLYSVFGEYQPELLEEYDLFFLDRGYGFADGSKQRVNARLNDYISYNTDINKDLLPVKGRDLWGIACLGAETKNYVLATDGMADAYYAQAVSYMEDKIGLSAAKKLLSLLDFGADKKQEDFALKSQESKNEMARIDEAKEAYKAEYDAFMEDPERQQEETMEKPSDAVNPLDTLSEIKNQSVLKLVMKNYEGISDKKLLSGKPVSGRTLQKGDGKPDKAIERNPLRNMLFQEYLFEKFSHALSEKTEGLLAYELEYILCGKGSDMENLESTAEKLLLLREGINFAYLLTDQVKMTEAFNLASALVGYLGIPALVVILQMALLLGWAFAESIIEVRMLLSGKKAALIKNADNWNLSLANLPELLSNLDCGKEEEKGMDYEGYLKSLIFFEKDKKKIFRSLDIIEGTVQKISGNKSFRMDNCTCSFQASGKFMVQPLFMNLMPDGNKEGGRGYSYTITRNYGY